MFNIPYIVYVRSAENKNNHVMYSKIGQLRQLFRFQTFRKHTRTNKIKYA